MSRCGHQGDIRHCRAHQARLKVERVGVAGGGGRFAATFIFKLKGKLLVDSYNPTSVDEKFYFVSRSKIHGISLICVWLLRSDAIKRTREGILSEFQGWLLI